jgi:hypothetical protein
MPGSGDGHRIPSSDAAAHLDRELAHLARLEGQLDRELGRGLALLWDREHYRRLGFVRATDFVREMLGIQEGRARWLAKLGRTIAVVPELDRELAQGRICSSQVIELGTILGPESPVEERLDWIARAERLGVRELRRAIRAEKQRRAAEESPAKESPAVSETDDPEAPAGGWMAIPAPARVGVLWHLALELARMASGQHLSPGQAAELMFAEYLSAQGLESASVEHGGSQSANGAPGDAARDRLVAEVIAALNRQSDELARPPAGEESKRGIPEEILRAAILASESALAIPREHPQPIPELSADCRVSEEQDPWELAAALSCLIGLKRHLRHELAGRLSVLMREVSPQQLGFPTLEAYCVERLGFGIGRAERLVRFQSGLAKFPLLAAAHLDGRVSYTATLLLLPILHPSTEAAWVIWADGITYRELERIQEHARTFALPEANPAVLEGFVRELEAQGLASRKSTADPEGESSAFAPAESSAAVAFDERKVPPGCALPPEPGGLPRIAGFPPDLLLVEAEFCIAQIRFWMPSDAFELAHRALDRCRYSMPDPFLRTWSYFQVILVHFIRTHDNPEAQRIERRHRIIARDHFRCVVPGCTSHGCLNSHHLEHQSQGGTDHDSNQAGACDGHHGGGVHMGIIDIGGFAPDRLVFRLGIHPKTGKALVCYRNERRVSPEVAAADLARWRQFWRDWHAHAERRGLLEEAMRAPAAGMEPIETVLQLA